LEKKLGNVLQNFKEISLHADLPKAILIRFYNHYCSRFLYPTASKEFWRKEPKIVATMIVFLFQMSDEFLSQIQGVTRTELKKGIRKCTVDTLQGKYLTAGDASTSNQGNKTSSLLGCGLLFEEKGILRGLSLEESDELVTQVKQAQDWYATLNLPQQKNEPTNELISDDIMAYYQPSDVQPMEFQLLPPQENLLQAALSATKRKRPDEIDQPSSSTMN
jgi:hypothetical protein